MQHEDLPDRAAAQLNILTEPFYHTVSAKEKGSTARSWCGSFLQRRLWEGRPSLPQAKQKGTSTSSFGKRMVSAMLGLEVRLHGDLQRCFAKIFQG
jgi:hypothetical protein